MSHLDADIELPDSLREVGGETNTLVVSPVWTSDGEEVLRNLALVPKALDELHLRRARVDFELGETAELISRIFLERTSDPVALAAVVMRSRELFQDDSAPRVGLGIESHPADLLLSSLYAHFIRFTAVGDTALAVEALDLELSPRAAAAKDDLEWAEHNAFMSSLADMYEDPTDVPTRPSHGHGEPAEIRQANVVFLKEHGFGPSGGLPLPRPVGAPSISLSWLAWTPIV